MNWFDEIGSEYWHADTSEQVINEIKNAVFTASGRSALSLIIKSLDLEINKVLLPAYTCQHIVEPFAWTGYEVDFYDINLDLSVCLDSLAKGIDGRPGCIVIQSYYGFNTCKEAQELLGSAQVNGCLIIEDVTHNLLSSWHPSYQEADYQFCSLRKWTGLTDGGYAVAKSGRMLGRPEIEMKGFVSSRYKAQIAKRKYVEIGDFRYKRAYLRLFAEAENMLDNDVSIYAMSHKAFELFTQVDFAMIAKRRCGNYSHLLNNIDAGVVVPIFKELEDGTCPIMFPVYVRTGREKLRQWLIENRIYCPVHWPAPIQLTPDARSSSKSIYNHIMSIPCDQRYDIKDLCRIVDVINSFQIRG